VVLLVGMAVAFAAAMRLSPNAVARQRAAEAIQSAIAFAGLILVFTLGVKLATALGALDEGDLSKRASMAMLGLFFMATGNAMPKSLTPLSTLQCSGARVQAFQRFAGWTWVLCGLAFAAAWLTLPVAVAKPVSMLALASGVLLIVRQLVRLRNCAGVASLRS